MNPALRAVLLGGVRPALSLALSSGAVPGGVSFSGGSNGTRVNSSGAVASATCPRFDHSPVSLAPLGMLVEQESTNSIRNSNMDGAAAGTPGTLPTNWAAALAGLTQTVVGTGTESGIPYIDVRFNGTTAGTIIIVRFDTNVGITAASGQSWSGSAYFRLIGGSLTNVTGNTLTVFENDAGGTSLIVTDAAFTPTSSPLSNQRVTVSRTFDNASTANTNLKWNATVTNGAAVDFTIRIGLPQLEQVPAVTSAIPTTSAAVTRSADSAIISGADFSASHHPEAGSAVVEFSLKVVTGTRPIISFDDDSANNRIELYASGTDLKLLVVSGGVTQADLTLGTVAANTTYKAAIAWRANDFAACMTGGQLVTDTAGTVPTVDRLRLGSNQAGDYMNGHLKKLDRWNGRVQTGRLLRSV